MTLSSIDPGFGRIEYPFSSESGFDVPLIPEQKVSLEENFSDEKVEENKQDVLFDPETVKEPVRQRSANIFQSSKEWVRRRKLAVTAGALALTSTVATATTADFEQVVENVKESAPWIVPVVAASEVSFIAGGAAMLAATGAKVGSVIKARKQIAELNETLPDKAQDEALWDNKLFKAGFIANAAGAIGSTAGLTVGVVESMPPQSWGVLGFAALEVGQTVALRAAAIGALRPSRDTVAIEANEANAELTKNKPVKIREALPEDIDGIVDLDLRMFDSAYGEEKPTREEVATMMAARLNNVREHGGWMQICEVGGKVEALMTIFPTNKPPEAFVSWEDSTANGTLDGVVDRDGKYGYVANLTVSPEGSKRQARQKLTASAFSRVMSESNIRTGYYESRMPQFAEWLQAQSIDGSLLPKLQLDELAKQYTNVRIERNGKQVPYDYQLRTHENAGMNRGPLVSDAFKDPDSLNYGMVFTTELPGSRLVRKMASKALSMVAKSSKLADKIF